MQSNAILLLLLLLAGHGQADNEAEHELVEWIKSLGGYVNPHQAIRTIGGENPDDISSFRGVFATDDIEEGELLLDLPMDAIIAADPEKTDDDSDMCGLVRSMKRELELGGQSSFAPYLRMLNHNVSLPDTFTEAGKNMLRKVVGPHLEPQNIGSHLRWWSTICKGDPTKNLAALLLVVTRSCIVDDVTIIAPFYDMYNHRNGFWENTRHDTKWRGKFKLYAFQKIEAGEQIYLSYADRGVAGVLHQWGFVEQLPHFWSFDIPARGGTTHKIEFVLEDKDGQLQFQWSGDAVPTPDGVNYLKTNEQNRLNSLEKEILCADSDSCPDDIPAHEMAVITQYYRVLKLAIDTAIEAAEEGSAGSYPKRDDIDVASSKQGPREEESKSEL